MYKRGLKLWSVNTDFYYDEAIKLFSRGVFDYIELYVVPETLDTLPKWKELKIPFIIHNPHFAQGFNLAKKEKAERNREIYEQTKRFADELGAKYIIFHGGIDGDIKETAKQLASYNESRALIENKPFVALPNRMGGNYCRGYNLEELNLVINEAKCGFCLDFGHAICAANSLYNMNKVGNNTPSPLEGEGLGEVLKKNHHFYSKESLNYSKELRKNMTEAEQILWYYLRNRQLNNMKFRRQEAIGEYIADFACYEYKLIIELDGSGHLESNQIIHDKKRDEYLTKSGFKVLRIYNNDVYENIEGVIDCILNEVEQPLTPRPSPTRGEGNTITPLFVEGEGLITRKEFVYNYCRELLQLKPNMYHLTDLDDITSPYDSHLHLGTGQLDFDKIFDMIPDSSYVTFETVKNSKTELNDFEQDMKWLENKKG